MTATVTDLVARLKGMGYGLYLEGEKVRFRYAGHGDPPEEAKTLLNALRAHKAEAVAYLKGTMPKPFLEPDGNLVIPFESDSRYHWWAGGQNITETTREITGAVNA